MAGSASPSCVAQPGGPRALSARAQASDVSPPKGPLTLLTCTPPVSNTVSAPLGPSCRPAVGRAPSRDGPVALAPSSSNQGSLEGVRIRLVNHRRETEQTVKVRVSAEVRTWDAPAYVGEGGPAREPPPGPPSSARSARRRRDIGAEPVLQELVGDRDAVVRLADGVVGVVLARRLVGLA